jgi:hypothetical protein
LKPLASKRFRTREVASTSTVLCQRMVCRRL